jgi:hypothetical protein
VLSPKVPPPTPADNGALTADWGERVTLARVRLHAAASALHAATARRRATARDTDAVRIAELECMAAAAALDRALRGPPVQCSCGMLEGHRGPCQGVF